MKNNTDASQFEETVDGVTAVLTYRLEPNTITFLHAGVPEEIEGRGIAGQLAVAGLNFARERGLRVVPQCPFVASYIKRHPAYQDLIATR